MLRVAPLVRTISRIQDIGYRVQDIGYNDRRITFNRYFSNLMSNLLFPIETLSRELDIRLVLSAMLARPGRRIYIGEKRLLHSIGAHLDGGVYLGKFVFQRVMHGNSRHFRRLLARGIRFVYLDEEGGVWQGDEEEWKRILPTRLDPSLFHDDELFLIWGKFQNDFYLENYPQARSQRFEIVGHPRFDLYKPEWNDFFAEETAQLRQRYGDFVLLNTNLGAANHVNGPQVAFSKRMGYYNLDGSLNPSYVPYWELKTHVLASFVRLVHELSGRIDQRIVVRPHPSESIDFYRYALAGLANVEVVREGAVTPWLHACKALIHDGCTTAIEARLAEKPVINWRPGGAAEFEHLLANSIGVRCRTTDEVVAVLRGDKAGEMLTDENGRLHKMLDNFNRESISRTVELIDGEMVKATGSAGTGSLGLQWRAIARRIEDRARLLTGVKSDRTEGVKTKFPGMDVDYVHRKMAFLQQRLNRPLPYRVFSNNLIVVG